MYHHWAAPRPCIPDPEDVKPSVACGTATEGRGEVTTNYSGERDSDEMKAKRLSPILSISPFLPIALDLCPPFTHHFSGAQISQMSRNARKVLVCATFVLLLISGAEEPTIYPLRAFAPLTLFAMGPDR